MIAWVVRVMSLMEAVGKDEHIRVIEQWNKERLREVDFRLRKYLGMCFGDGVVFRGMRRALPGTNPLDVCEERVLLFIVSFGGVLFLVRGSDS